MSTKRSNKRHGKSGPRRGAKDVALDEHVGARLREMRKAAGWSQTELAEKLGVSFQQVQKNESGANRIGASRLWRLCVVLGVGPSAFFEGL